MKGTTFFAYSLRSSHYWSLFAYSIDCRWKRNVLQISYLKTIIHMYNVHFLIKFYSNQNLFFLKLVGLEEHQAKTKPIGEEIVRSNSITFLGKIQLQPRRFDLFSYFYILASCPFQLHCTNEVQDRHATWSCIAIFAINPFSVNSSHQRTNIICILFE